MLKKNKNYSIYKRRKLTRINLNNKKKLNNKLWNLLFRIIPTLNLHNKRIILFLIKNFMKVLNKNKQVLIKLLNKIIYKKKTRKKKNLLFYRNEKDYFLLKLLLSIVLLLVMLGGITLFLKKSFYVIDTCTLNDDSINTKEKNENTEKENTDSWFSAIIKTTLFVSAVFAYQTAQALYPEATALAETVVFISMLIVSGISGIKFLLNEKKNPTTKKAEKRFDLGYILSDEGQEAEPFGHRMVLTIGGFYSGYGLGVTYAPYILPVLPFLGNEITVGIASGIAVGLVSFFYPEYWEMEFSDSTKEDPVSKKPADAAPQEQASDSLSEISEIDENENLLQRDEISESEEEASEQFFDALSEIDENENLLQRDEISESEEEASEQFFDALSEIDENQEVSELPVSMNLHESASISVVDSQAAEEGNTNQSVTSITIPTDPKILNEKLSNISQLVKRTEQLTVESSKEDLITLEKDLTESFKEVNEWRQHVLNESFKYEKKDIQVFTENRLTEGLKLPLSTKEKFIKEIGVIFRNTYMIDIEVKDYIKFENTLLMFDLDKLISRSGSSGVQPEALKSFFLKDTEYNKNCRAWCSNENPDHFRLRKMVSYYDRLANYSNLGSDDLKAKFREVWGNNVSPKTMNISSWVAKKESYEMNAYYDRILRENRTTTVMQEQTTASATRADQQQDS